MENKIADEADLWSITLNTGAKRLGPFWLNISLRPALRTIMGRHTGHT